MLDMIKNLVILNKQNIWMDFVKFVGAVTECLWAS